MSASVTLSPNYPILYVQFPVFSSMLLGLLAKNLIMYAVDLYGNVVNPASVSVQTSGSPVLLGSWPFTPVTSLIISSAFYYPQTQFYLTTQYTVSPMFIGLDYPALAISVQFMAYWSSP